MPTAVASEEESFSTASASACHIGGPNYVKPGELELVYGSNIFSQVFKEDALLRNKRPLDSYACPD